MPENSTQVPKDLAELKQGWYSISKLCEGLKRYKSVKDEGFEGFLDSMLSGIEGFEKLLDEVYRSIIRGYPSRPEKLESQRNEILDEIAHIKERIRGDQKRIASLKEKDEESIRAKLEKLQQQHEDVGRLTSEKCSKYFERKREYTIAFEKIEREVSNRLEVIRDAFVEKTADVVEGCEIVFNEQSISVEELFNTIIAGNANIDGIQTKSLEKGGLFDTIKGTASKHELAKESVLKYEAQEIVQKALPLKKKEAELIVKLDLNFNDLKGLEEDCKKAEEKREDIVQLRDKLRMELEGFDASEKLGGTYLKVFDEVTPKVESFISLTKVVEESKAVPEEEKEEVLAEIEAKEEELDYLKTKISEGPSKEELLAYKKRLEELKSRIGHLETEIERQIGTAR